MSSYISVGIVSNDEKEVFIKKCNKIFTNFSNHINDITLKYPINNKCDDWIECDGKKVEISKMLDICYRNNLAEMTISYRCNKRLVKGIIVRIRKAETKYSGILFETPEYNFKMEDEIDELEKRIIINIKRVLSIGFDYAYCDNETDIEKSIEEVLQEKNIYSILLVNKNRSFYTKLGSWKIDGLSSR